MADYYTSFSCSLDVCTPQNIIQALELYQTMNEERMEEDESELCFALFRDTAADTRLWIHDDGSGNAEDVILFVKRCATTLNLSGFWGFEWADTCSKPRYDAFGGSAHVIKLKTGDTVAWLSTNEWLTHQLSQGGDDA